MELLDITRDIADILKGFDSEAPLHKAFQAGIGPFGEPQLVSEISRRLNLMGENYKTRTKRTPDLDVNGVWALEFKIVRPFGDNGREAEDWSVNVLHPYEGNISLIGDAIKLSKLNSYLRKGLFLIGYEHSPAKIQLDPLLDSFELIIKNVIGLSLNGRIEETRRELVHPEHQVVRCIAWEVL
jgi:hypothetical protein